MNKNIRDYINLIENAQIGESEGVAEGYKMLSLDDKIKIYSKHKSQAQQAENRGDYTTADKHKKQASRIYSNIVNLHFGDDSKDAQNAANEYIRKSQGVAEGLNEFAPDGFNGGDDGEGFSPEIAKMAQEDGFTKGASLADGATLERAITINHWHSQHGGMYKQYFAKGFKAGRLEKIRHDNKQYNLNLKLMKDGSIHHGEQK